MPRVATGWQGHNGQSDYHEWRERLQRLALSAHPHQARHTQAQDKEIRIIEGTCDGTALLQSRSCEIVTRDCPRDCLTMQIVRSQLLCNSGGTCGQYISLHFNVQRDAE